MSRIEIAAQGLMISAMALETPGVNKHTNIAILIDRTGVADYRRNEETNHEFWEFRLP